MFGIAFSLIATGCVVRGGQPKREKTAVVAQAPVGDRWWVEATIPPRDSGGPPRAGGSVVVALGSEPPSLNTLIHADWVASKVVDGRIYEGLVDTDPYDHPNYRYRGRLAERWEVSADGRVYRFFLRQGVRWHDGHAFSAADVLATFGKIRDESVNAAELRSYYELLQDVRRIDDSTVEFRWKEPYFKSLEAMGVGIQPAHIIAPLSGKAYNEPPTNPLMRHPVGTGPFRFASWVTNERIVLERNDAYYGRKPWLDQLVFRFVRDPSSALLLAGRGEVDVLQTNPELWVKRLDTGALSDRFYRTAFYDANYSWIGWNQQRPMFRDRRVRQALTMLTNRPGIIRGLLYGLAKPTDCHFYWAGNQCAPTMKPIPFDPERAVALLEESGWIDRDGDGVRERDGVPFQFELMIPNRSVDGRRIATVLKDDFQRAGIDLYINTVEWSTFVSRLDEQAFDACSLGWGGGARQDPTQVWHSRSRKGGSNFIGFESAEGDRLMEKARAILDDDERDAVYRQFSDLLYREQPYTVLYVRPQLGLVSRRIRGVQTTLGWWQFEDWWLAPDHGTR